MTLEPYDPQRLDQFTLRVLDLCVRLRKLAQRSREEQITHLPLHDKKALEWIDKLEEWAHKAEADLELTVLKNRGARRADAARSALQTADANSRKRPAKGEKR